MDRPGVAERSSASGNTSAWRRYCSVMIIPALLLLVAGLASADEELHRSGTVRIKEVQLAWIFSSNLGGGDLEFNGRTYNFTVGGLGIGGFGVSEIKATGEVYNLTDIAYFPGAYVEGRWGFAVGDVSRGHLWIKNSHGVYLHLKAEREGLALSLGGDALYINLK